MRFFLFIFLFILLHSCKKEEVSTQPSENSEALIEITSLNQMNNEIANGVSLVFFHASWCSVCQNQKPAVELLSTDSELSEVFLGEVEYDDHPDIVTAASVEGFPTILIYKDGQEVDRYLGGGHTTHDLKVAILAHL